MLKVLRCGIALFLVIQRYNQVFTSSQIPIQLVIQFFLRLLSDTSVP